MPRKNEKVVALEQEVQDLKDKIGGMEVVHQDEIEKMELYKQQELDACSEPYKEALSAWYRLGQLMTDKQYGVRHIPVMYYEEMCRLLNLTVSKIAEDDNSWTHKTNVGRDGRE